MKGKNYFVGLLTLLAITFSLQLNGQCNSTCSDLIFNGDFEQGNIGFTSDLTHNSACAYTSYAIEHNALDKCNNGGWNSVTDHTTGSGLFMVVDGDDQLPANVWETNVTFTAGDAYEFNFWVYPTVSVVNRPRFDILVGGTVVGSFDANSISPVQWAPACITFTAPVSGNVPIVIRQTNAGGYGYDYGLDDISLRPVNCCSCGVDANFLYGQEDCVTFNFSSVSSGNACTEVLGNHWDFGDGTTASGNNVSHVFPGPGTYNVCLQSVGFDGFSCCTDSICYTVVVPDCDTCVCDVTPDFLYQANECKVDFTDRSFVNDPCVRIIGWDWDFGDGTGSNVQNPSHTYSSSGVYVVCLTTIAVADGDTCKRTICYDVRVTCPPCECHIVPQFSYLVNGCDVRFFDISIPDSCVNIFQWHWDFGDGSTSTLQNPLHQYGGPGSYGVCLTVWGENGAGDTCMYRVCAEVPVEECERCECIDANLIPDFDFQIDECKVTFTDMTIADPCLNVFQWHWDFGDGTTSNLQNPVHTYASSGGYGVCLTVWATNGQGDTCKVTVCKDFEVECKGCPCELKPDFIFEQDMCRIQFIDRTETNCEILSWNWDFGDGTHASVQNPVHQYENPGTYRVCLTVVVYDPETRMCCEETICYEVVVEDCKPCECRLDIFFQYDVQGCEVHFATDYASECDVVDVSWDFGDGNTVSGTFSPGHSYAYNGVYNVCITVYYIDYDGKTCAETYCETVTITDCKEGPCNNLVPASKSKSSLNSPETESSSPFGVQIYPNPTSGKVSVDFSLPAAGKVGVEVYDGTGKRIATLADSKMESGEHTLNWDLSKSGMATGVYYVLVKSGDKSEYKKIVFED